jgi:hypothetical protein
MRVLQIVWAVVMVVVAAPAARAQPSAPADSDAATIRDRENVWTIAIVDRDSSALIPMLGSEYVVAASPGQPAVARRQYLHEIAYPRDSSTHVTRITFDELRIRKAGPDREIAEGIVTEVGTNSKGAVIDRIRFVDVWVRRDRRWVCVSSKFTPAPAAKPKAT